MSDIPNSINLKNIDLLEVSYSIISVNNEFISMKNLLKFNILTIILGILTFYPASKLYASEKKEQGCMILVEGLDLSGKSTITKALINNLQKSGYEVSYSHNVLVPNNPINIKAQKLMNEQHHANLLEIGALFLAAHMYDAKVFNYPEYGTFHIQDSSWLRTVAYNLLFKSQYIPELIKECSVFYPKFDVVIYLTASNEERRKRILQRKMESKENYKTDYVDLLSWLDPGKLQLYDKLLFEQTLEVYPKSYKIDTTNLTIDSVLKDVLLLIKKECKNRID